MPQKIFISWSGPRARAVGELLADWIKCVLQATRPWISARDIDRGAVWFNKLFDELGDTDVGIVVLTKENQIRPWILFESGALAKGLSTSRVCTLLADLTPSEVEDPLAQFNHTLANRDGIWALVRTFNGLLGGDSLPERVLEQVFNTYWPQFEERFAKALAETHAPMPKREKPQAESLAELADQFRTLSQLFTRLERSIDVVNVVSNLLQRHPKGYQSLLGGNVYYPTTYNAASSDPIISELRQFLRQQLRTADDPLQDLTDGSGPDKPA